MASTVSASTVTDVIVSPVITVRQDATYRDLVETICGEPRISGVPVVDDRHRVIGVVSEADLMLRQEFPDDERNVRWLAILGTLNGRAPRSAEMLEHLRKAEARDARDLMSAPAIVITREATLQEAAALMDRMAVKRLVVVEGDMHPVGIVTRSDLLKAFLRAPARRAARRRARVAVEV